jgi:hypothetical protein
MPNHAAWVPLGKRGMGESGPLSPMPMPRMEIEQGKIEVFFRDDFWFPREARGNQSSESRRGLSGLRQYRTGSSFPKAGICRSE